MKSDLVRLSGNPEQGTTYIRAERDLREERKGLVPSTKPKESDRKPMPRPYQSED